MFLSVTFLIAAILLAVTPGPGIAYVVARTASGGRSEGLASCLGTALGGLLHVLAAALGFSLLIAQSATAFSLVKYVGAAYLVYLGLRLLLSRGGTQSMQSMQATNEAPALTPQGPRKAFYEGVLVEALNVKTALFFLAFLPQFVFVGQPVIPQLVLMGVICVFLNTLVDVVAVYAAASLLESRAAHAARARLLTRVSGLTMIGLGGYLALARRDP